MPGAWFCVDGLNQRVIVSLKPLADMHPSFYKQEKLQDTFSKLVR